MADADEEANRISLAPLVIHGGKDIIVGTLMSNRMNLLFKAPAFGRALPASLRHHCVRLAGAGEAPGSARAALR